MTLEKTKMKYNLDYYKILGYSLIPINIFLILLLELDFFGKLPVYWNSLWVFYIFLIINTWFLALRLKHIPDEKEREQDYTVFLSRYFFLLGLVVIAVNQFVKRQIVIDYMPHIIGVVIALGFLTFFASRNRIEKEIEDEKTGEEEAEKKRKGEFAEKFKRISKLNLSYGIKDAWKEKSLLKLILMILISPIVFLVKLPYKITKWVYKEGWGYVLALLIIIIIFVVIKYPYMGLDFSGLHDMKYSSYVEPAKHMLEKGILWNERKYITDPVTLVNGTYDTFGSYPIMEWGLYSTFRLFPFNSIEFNSRLFMTFIGILILISIYLFFKKFFNKKQTLLILLLLSINFIFQFFTYVTVVDSLNILFMFVSLIFLAEGLKNNNVKYLFLSGIIAGIGINIKYHAIIFYLPLFICLIYFYKKLDESTKLSYLIIIISNFLFQTLFFRISIRYLPRSPLLFGLIFFVLILLHLFLYFKIEKIYSFINKIIKEKIGPRVVYLIILILSLLLVYILLKVEWISLLFNDFITDRYLIFNFKLYDTFFQRFKEWLTPHLYFLGLIWMIGLLFIKSRKLKLISYLFLTSSIIYLISTSKVLYFHEYYHHIIIITFILFASNLYILYKSFKDRFIKLLFIVAVLILVIPGNLNIVDKNLSKQKENVLDIGNYLKENMNDNEFFLMDNSVPSSISFYSDKKSMMEIYSFPYNQNLTDTLKSELESSNNLSYTMEKYKIKYYITKGPKKSVTGGLIYLFDKDIKQKMISYSQRTILILCKENNICLEKENLPSNYQDTFDKKIKSYLIFEKQIGDYYIYRFY